MDNNLSSIGVYDEDMLMEIRIILVHISQNQVTVYYYVVTKYD